GQLAEPGLQGHGSAYGLADPDAAVGGLRGHPGQLPVDGDVAVGRVDPADARELADPGGPVRILDHRCAGDVAQAHRAAARRDVGVALDVVDDDVAEAGVQPGRSGTRQAQLAVPGLHPALAELAVDVHVSQAGVTLQARPGRDGDVDRDGAA